MNTFEQLWQKALDLMSQELPSVTVSTWLVNLKPIELTSDRAVFTVEDELQKKIITDRYAATVKKYLNEVMGFAPEIVIKQQVLPEYVPPEAEEAPVTSSFPKDAEKKYSVLENYTFENFIVGQSNKLAHAAALFVSDHPGTQFNPLFIYGNSGLGKTHLLYAIVNRLEKNFPDFNILYVTTEDFLNQLVDAISSRENAQFREKYRKVDVFLMDDVQFLSKTEAVQEEVFHTINALYLAGKQIIITSDRPPDEIPKLSERLKTRLVMGTPFDVKQPDFETRVAILQKKAELVGLNVTKDMLEYAAAELNNNVRQLEGLINKLKILLDFSGAPRTIETVRAAIVGIKSAGPSEHEQALKIIEGSARHFGVEVEKVQGRPQDAETTRARQVAMYLIRDMLKFPYSIIGSKYFGRQHTTVKYSIEKIEQEMKDDVALRHAVLNLKNNLSLEMEN